MADSSDVKEILAAIKKTKGMKDRIHKEIGLKTATDVESEEDMYLFSFKKPDLEESRGGHIILHGKCVEAGTAELIEWGYELIREREYPKSVAGFCFVKCEQCGERLDEAVSARTQAERDAAYTRKRDEMLEMQQFRKEWEAEQILLGNI